MFGWLKKIIDNLFGKKKDKETKPPVVEEEEDDIPPPPPPPEEPDDEGDIVPPPPPEEDEDDGDIIPPPPPEEEEDDVPIKPPVDEPTFEEQFLNFDEIRHSVSWIQNQFQGVDHDEPNAPNYSGTIFLSDAKVQGDHPFGMLYDTFYQGPLYGKVTSTGIATHDLQISGYVKLDAEYKLPYFDVAADASFEVSRVGKGLKVIELVNKNDGTVIDRKMGDAFCVRSFKFEFGDPEFDDDIMVDRCYTYDQCLSSLMFTGLVEKGHPEYENWAHRSAVGVMSLLVNNDRDYPPKIGNDPNAMEGASLWSAPHHMGYPGYWETQHRTAIDGWVAQALMRYMKAFPSYSSVYYEAEKYARRTMDWLLSCIATDGLNRGVPIHGYNGWENGVWIEKKYPFSGIEGTIEAYHAFKLASEVLGDDKYHRQFIEVKRVLLDHFWSDRYNRFLQGVQPKGYDEANALDIMSWGAILLMDMGEIEKARKSLEQLERFESQSANGSLTGYRPFNPHEGYSGAKIDNVWYEGSFGVLLAYHKAYEHGIYGREKYETLLKDLLKGKQTDHSFRYSSDEDVKYDFIPRKSVASTSWYVFATELRDWMW